MMTRVFLIATAVIVLSTPASAQEEPKLDSQKAKFSYTMGYQMALSLQRPGMELDEDILVQAIRDAMNGVEPRLSRNEMDATIAAQRQLMQDQRNEKADENLARGEAFLEENKQRDVVTETESGLQYEVLEEGQGDQPTESDTVVVHYEGALVDGSVFDSSYERGSPATLPLNGVIEGWQEGLQLMKEGGKYKFYIPAKLAYGKTGAGDRIGPNETLVFQVELIEVK